MAEVAPAPAAAAAPPKAAKKKAAPKAKKPGPSLGELIVKAVAASKERNGVSLAALKKALAAEGYDVDKNKARVKTAIKGLVAKGTLVQTKGTGASGSFKINKKADCQCSNVCIKQIKSHITNKLHTYRASFSVCICVRPTDSYNFLAPHDDR
uniref:Histone H1 n=1 Tax=Echeneis naucrates TaxID=173247 RepID=A0A665W5R7_ECHNA